MVRKERNMKYDTYIPECTCNKRILRIKWKEHYMLAGEQAKSTAEDHEELHVISKAIVEFIADTGKMTKEDIIEGFPDYNEGQLSIAANMSMYPIIFGKRRHMSPQQIEQLKKHVYQLTEQYREAKYTTPKEIEDVSDSSIEAEETNDE